MPHSCPSHSLTIYLLNLQLASPSAPTPTSLQATGTPPHTHLDLTAFHAASLCRLLPLPVGCHKVPLHLISIPIPLSSFVTWQNQRTLPAAKSYTWLSINSQLHSPVFTLKMLHLRGLLVLPGNHMHLHGPRTCPLSPASICTLPS